jgi:hypothetical protein
MLAVSSIKRCMIIEDTNLCKIKICMIGKTGIQQKITNKNQYETCKKFQIIRVN